VFRTHKAACLLFRACSFWSRRVKSLSESVSSSLEKKRERTSRSVWRRSVVGQVHLLFACLCPVSAFRLSSTLPCKSLISLCFKTCLLPKCYLLSIIRIIIQAARCNCVNLLSSSCERLTFCYHKYLDAQDVHAAPPHTALPSPIHRPCKPDIFTTSNN
jgi:hypothetical protein